MNPAMTPPGPGRHPLGLSAVIGLHVVIAAALIAGAKPHVTPKPTEGGTVHFDDHPPPPPPPPKDPALEAPPMTPPTIPYQMPPPKFEIDRDHTVVDESGPPVRPDRREDVGDHRVSPPPDPPRHVSLAHAARIDARAPGCRPEYPSSAARVGATGVSRIRFTVDARGRVVRAETLQSSGSTREHRLLDRAAADALQACPITPGTDEDGRPTGATVDVEYAWTVE